MISRYRPRSPSVDTGLLSMDILPIVTAFRSTSSGHHCASLELSLGRSFPSLEMSYCGALIGRRWSTPQLLTHRTDRKVHWEATFHIGYRLRCVSCPRIHLLQSVKLILLPIPTTKEMDTIRLGGLHCKVSETSRKASLSS